MATDLFDAEQSWLAQQPGMNPWNAGCERLREQLGRWLSEYSGRVCERAVPDDFPGRPQYLARLWGCWSYHWRGACPPNGGVNGWDVARRLRAGVGAQGRGDLGGDPLRDVVLAEAVVQRDNAATRRLESEYRELARGLIRRVRPSFLTECPDWWDEFVDRLAGYSRPPGKLTRYSGRCGLRHWLATVLRRFVYDHRPPPRPAEFGLLDDEEAELVGAPAPDEALITGECIALFVGMIRSALKAVEPGDHVLLRLTFVDGLNGREAARVLGIDPGTVSRRKAKALEALAGALDDAQNGVSPGGRGEECLQHLLGGDRRITFGGALLEALREVAQAGVRE